MYSSLHKSYKYLQYCVLYAQEVVTGSDSICLRGNMVDFVNISMSEMDVNNRSNNIQNFMDDR